MNGRKPAESASEMVQIVMPGQSNTHGNLFGGILMQWLDLVASVAVKRHCRKVVVTASMDRLDFKASAKVGDIVVLKARVNRAFRTSMEAGVRVIVENLDTGDQRLIARCYMTYVALDEDGKPTEVPPIEPDTTEDHRRYKEAGIRRNKRLEGTC